MSEVPPKTAEPVDPEDRPELRTLRRRAYEELNAAIDQAGSELSGDWLADGDPDLQALRELEEPQWQLLVRRHTGRESPKDPQFPDPAWGDPHRRRNEWIGMTVVLATLAPIVFVLFFFSIAATIAALLLAAASWGSYQAVKFVAKEAQAADARSVRLRKERAAGKEGDRGASRRGPVEIPHEREPDG